ncbi:helix-turn-helix domain-containing protein [Spongiibacter sp. KMU-158]|uniref:Helix-turn-helix domain-containing protein n=1 Tax=Spongiibacter pelagi TaxID=2760804 RepID=A0A927C1E8_9GAMM|nr:helix-turn-helix domain-containing protein [Spongiibacter pelagi]MBD2858969.1 helix-turn-helix domain-containing protein [Spongiibacter pelagi]
MPIKPVKRVALLAFDQALMTSLSLPMELLNAAAHHLRLGHPPSSRSTPLTLELVGQRDTCTLSGFLPLEINHRLTPGETFDIIFIPSRWRHPERSINPELLEWLVNNALAGAEICAVGNGSYLLAAAGLLDYRPATTHWHYFEDFAKRFPQVLLQRDYLMTESGKLFCAGSVNSAADLTLHLIENHWGRRIAQRVAQQFSPESRRPFSRHGFHSAGQSAHGDELIAMCQSYIASHLSETLSIAELASAHDLSLRSFQRRFSHATGLSPQQYLRKIRLETAEELLRNSNLSITDISHHCGFNDTSYFGKLFREHYETSPAAYRQSVRRKLFAIDRDAT